MAIIIVFISITFLLLVYLVARSITGNFGIDKLVEHELATLTKLVSQSTSADRLPAYKEQLWTLWAKANRKHTKEIEELIADVNRRQYEWMGLELDDVINEMMRRQETPRAPVVPTNNIEKKPWNKFHHKKPTHRK